MPPSSVRRRYALLLARDVAQSSSLKTETSSEGDLDSAPWWKTWTAKEKSCFLHAVAIHSRLRPDLIAEELQSRSVEEVSYVLRKFRRSLHKIQRMEQAMNRFSRAHVLQLCSSAREMSSEWTDLEDQCADALASAEDQLVFADQSNQIQSLADFLRQPQSDTMTDLVKRLVVPDSSESPSSRLQPSEAYSAFSHTQSVPALPSYERIASAVEALIDQGYLQCPSEIPRPIQASTILQPVQIVWSHPHDTPLIDREALIYWLQRHTHGDKVPYLKHDTIPTLIDELKVFLVHVLNELISVQQRTLHLNQIEEQHVWAAVARLGFVTPSMNLHQELVSAVAIQRALADPPVAWTHPISSGVCDRSIPIDETLSSESDSDFSGLSESASAAYPSSDSENEMVRENQVIGNIDHRDTNPPRTELSNSNLWTVSNPGPELESDANSLRDATHQPNLTEAPRSSNDFHSTLSPHTPFLTGDHRRIGSMHPILPYEYEQEPTVTSDTNSCSDTSSNSEMISDTLSARSGTDSDNDSEIDRLDQIADVPYQQELYEWLGLVPESQDQDREQYCCNEE